MFPTVNSEVTQRERESVSPHVDKEGNLAWEEAWHPVKYGELGKDFKMSV